jgi:hypothetical protein
MVYGRCMPELTRREKSLINRQVWQDLTAARAKAWAEQQAALAEALRADRRDADADAGDGL